MGKSRKAGDKGMAAYVKYLNNYDRTIRGSASKGRKDKFSGLDVRHVRDAASDFGVGKKDAAREILKYARRVEDETRMGGIAHRELDKLRALLDEPGKPKPKPKPKPNPGKPAPVKPEKPSVPDQIVRDVISEGEGIASPIQQYNPVGITGDNNQVNQDNSISQTIDNRDQSDNSRFYGGSSRIFNADDEDASGASTGQSFLDKFLNKNFRVDFDDPDFTPLNIRQGIA